MIYAVMYANYSDWELYGYFTTLEEAEKYVVKYPKRELHIEVLDCLDGQEDLSTVKVRYEQVVTFDYVEGAWRCEVSKWSPDIYQSPYPRSNKVNFTPYNGRTAIWVNTTENNPELQKKIAQDIFYQFMESCNKCPTREAIESFNKILSADEDARKLAKDEEKLRQKELKEYERLKAKYGE